VPAWPCPSWSVSPAGVVCRWIWVCRSALAARVDNPVAAALWRRLPSGWVFSRQSGLHPPCFCLYWWRLVLPPKVWRNTSESECDSRRQPCASVLALLPLRYVLAADGHACRPQSSLYWSSSRSLQKVHQWLLPPSYAVPSHYRFSKLFRKEAPDGRGRTFVPDHVSIRIRFITKRHLLFPSSQTRTPVGSPCSSLSCFQ